MRNEGKYLCHRVNNMEFKLIELATGRQLGIGDIVKDRDGNEGQLEYLQQPHKPGSSGKVEVVGKTHTGMYYPSVVGARFFAPAKMPICPTCGSTELVKHIKEYHIVDAWFESGNGYWARKTDEREVMQCHHCAKVCDPSPEWIFAQPNVPDDCELVGCGHCGTIDLRENLFMDAKYLYLCDSDECAGLALADARRRRTDPC